MYVFGLHVSLCNISAPGTHRGQKRDQIFWNWCDRELLVTIWVLETKPMSSTRAFSPLSHQAMPQAQHLDSSYDASRHCHTTTASQSQACSVSCKPILTPLSSHYSKSLLSTSTSAFLLLFQRKCDCSEDAQHGFSFDKSLSVLIVPCLLPGMFATTS